MRAYKRYGLSSFTFEILFACDDREIRELLEQEFLDREQPFGKRGFNSCRIVGSTKGLKLTKEQVARIAAASKGRKHTPETIEKIRQAKLKNNPQRGRPLTERQKEALYKKGETHPWYNRNHKPESLLAIRIANAKPVAQIDSSGKVVAIHPFASDAAALVGIKSPDSIYRACNSAHRMAAGYYWRYVADGIVVGSVIDLPPRPASFFPDTARIKSIATRCRPIVQFKDGIAVGEFPTAVAAASSVGVRNGSILRAIARKRPCRGFLWGYADRAQVS